jgi:hypothetical protein
MGILNSAANTEISAMLADKYFSSSRSLIICSPDWTNKTEQQNIISSSLTLLSSGSG